MEETNENIIIPPFEEGSQEYEESQKSYRAWLKQEGDRKARAQELKAKLEAKTITWDEMMEWNLLTREII